MLNIVKNTVEFYLKYLKTPSINDININDEKLLNSQWSIFVTIYKNWEVRWSAWNIKELKTSIAQELIENTVEAISKDSRFSPLKANENKNLKYRIDIIKDRKILKDGELKKLDPVKNGVLVIKKDYEKMACILPNISPKLLTWEDFLPVLKAKLRENKFNEKDYYIYSIDTEIVRD